MTDDYFMSDEFFEHWLRNIAEYSQFIADTNAVRNVWVHGAQNVTSAYCVGELLEQLLGDLHLQEEILRFEDRLRSIGALERFGAFAKELVALEKGIKDDPRIEQPKTLLASQAWEDLQAASNDILQLPSIKAFMS